MSNAWSRKESEVAATYPVAASKIKQMFASCTYTDGRCDTMLHPTNRMVSNIKRVVFWVIGLKTAVGKARTAAGEGGGGSTIYFRPSTMLVESRAALAPDLATRFWHRVKIEISQPFFFLFFVFFSTEISWPTLISAILYSLNAVVHKFIFYSPISCWGFGRVLFWAKKFNILQQTK